MGSPQNLFCGVKVTQFDHETTGAPSARPVASATALIQFCGVPEQPAVWGKIAPWTPLCVRSSHMDTLGWVTSL